MAAGRVVLSEFMPARDRNDRLVSGALLNVYQNRTTTKATIYTNAAMTTPLANPVAANASGQFPAIWAERGSLAVPVLYTLSVTGASGESIGNPSVFDDFQPSVDDAAAESAANAAAANATAQIAASLAAGARDSAQTAQTAAEAAAALAAAQLATVTAAGATAVANVDDAAAALFYADTAAGLAAVAEGGFFKVVVDGRINTYRDLSGVAVLQASTPSKADLDAAVARSNPFKSAVIGGAAQINTLYLESQDEPGLYAGEYFVRYCTRNASNTFYLTINRTSDSSVLASAGAGGTSIDPTGYVGVRKVPLLEVGGSGITGYAWVDFGAGLTFGALIAYAATDTVIDNDKAVFSSPYRVATINRLAGRISPSTVFPIGADTYLASLVTDFKIEGGDVNHVYILNYETVLIAGTPNTYRVRFYLRDLTDAMDVAQWTYSSATDTTVALPPTAFLTQVSLGTPFDELPAPNTGPYTGITATAWIDWSVIEWTRALTTYTAYANCGILSSNVYTNDRMDVFLDRAEPKIRLSVGAGTTSATHFNSIAAAAQSLYLSGVTITRSTFPCSDICTFSNQVLIEVVDDAYTEDLGTGGTGGEGLLIPHYCTLRIKPDTMFKRAGNATGLPPVIEGPFSYRLEGYGTVRQNGRGYVLHHDNLNGLSKPSSVGPAVQHYFIRRVVQARLEASATSQDWIIGEGVSDGQTTLIDRSRIIREGTNTAPFHGAHTSPGSVRPGKIHWRNSSANDSLITGSSGAIHVRKSHAMTDLNHIIVEGCEIGAVTTTNVAGGNAGFVRIGGKSGASWDATLDPT